jgi:Right handed beta helix region
MRIIMAVLIILIAVPAMSAVMHVTNSQEFQVALTAAANNGESDTILLAEGTYNGGFSHLSMENYDLAIQAEDGLTAENVIIDGGGLYRVLNLVSLNYQTTVTLNNLTVQNGSQAVHGGLYVETGGDIVITDCVFHSNAGGQTVAVYGKASSDRSISFLRNIVRNNSSGAYSSQNSGAAVSLSILARGTMLVEDNVISDNSVRAKTGAGGLDIHNVGFATVRRNTIRNNVGGSFAAGGFHIFEGSVTFSDNTVQGNSSLNGPGVTFNTRSADINGNVISCNTNDFGWVAGLFLRPISGGAVISNNLIFDNDNLSTSTSNPRTGGVYVDIISGGTQSITLTNNTITGNSSYAAAGVMANIAQGSYVYMYNNIVWGNGDSGQGSVDIILEGFGTKYGFNNNYTSLTGLWGAYGENIDTDPMFIDMGGEDYHLKSSSQCINTGKNDAPNLPDTDLDGTPRIKNKIVDMGAYEFTKRRVTSACLMLLLED